MEKINILAVDDEQEMLVSYRKILTRAGYGVHTATSARNALEILNEDHTFVLMICDLKMPGMDGMDLLQNIKRDHPYLPVIMVTGHGSLEQGVEAVKSGVFDFIEKPFSTKKLLKSVEDALMQISPQKQEDGENGNGFGNMVGNSPAMQKIFEMIRKVAYGNANVIITGESGVGKELVMRCIHNNSLRRNQALIPINCGALPASLFESELFGYEKGAFTGAFQAKPGLVELANGGTLFLDEICEMPLDLQVKLLRMLEDRKIRRIGGKTEIPVDIRIISATNRDVQGSIDKGVLREDLYFRISTIQITVPPLRERGDDILLLVEHFLNDLNQKYHRQVNAFEAEAMAMLRKYDWPGNVRELQNVIERAYYLATPPVISSTDLPAHLQTRNGRQRGRDWNHLKYREAKEIVLEEFEKDYLKYQLKKYDWNISRTAEACEIDRRTIHRLINRFDLKN